MQAGEPSDNAGGGAPGRSGNGASKFRLVELQLSQFVSSHRLSWADLSRPVPAAAHAQPYDFNTGVK